MRSAQRRMVAPRRAWENHGLRSKYRKRAITACVGRALTPKAAHPTIVIRMQLPYSREKGLLIAAAICAALFWASLLYVLYTAAERWIPENGIAAVAALVFAAVILTYLLSRWRRVGQVAFLRGHAVELSDKQYPDLLARVRQVAKRLDLAEAPEAYLYDRGRDAASFSLSDGGRDIVALNAELVGAFNEHPGALDFFVGFEIGWLQHPLTRWWAWFAPARVLPLLGPAVGRARVYTADRFGLLACRAKADAALALAVFASGPRRWRSFNIAHFAAQSASAMNPMVAVVELLHPEPWLARRIAHLRAVATDNPAVVPERHLLAYVLALFVPGLAWRHPGASGRAIFILLWAGLAGIAGYAVYGMLDEPLLATRSIRSAAAPASTPPAATGARAVSPTTADTRGQLDADLKTLGELAATRFRKHGGNPCEVGNIGALRLNFPAQRYAYSCDEPIVYTVVAFGEFDPGRPSYVRAYHWKEVRFTEQLSRSPASSEGAGSGPSE